MNTLRVELGDRTYPIHIGSGMLARVELIRPLLVKGGRVAYITNTTVAPLYLKALQDMVGSANAIEIILPDGEQYKTLDSMNVIYGSMLEARLDRTSTVIALGGGVIGDMAGFAAATYQRGISFIQVPTTLLSQVDSSVGGKTGVNHPLGKNMIGAFYQPRAVIIDTDTLKTLPDRELSAGLAEVIKYGLIRDATFFSWLEANMERLLARDPGTLQTAIQRSCEIKADVVAADEKEGGVRAILNFGHTFGHAIETGMGYGSWLHGEAIAVGMVMAAQMSSRLGWINESDVERTTELIRRARLPIRPPPVLSRERFRELMSVDKKVLAGKLRLVLLRAMGEAVVTSEFPPTVLDEILGHPPTAR